MSYLDEQFLNNFKAENSNNYSNNLKFKIMNTDQLEGKWNEIKGKFKQKYGKLTDDDISFTEGKFDEMLGKVQNKIGKKKEDILEEIENW